MDDPKEIDVHQGSPFVPQDIKDKTAGPRRSIAPLLALIDTSEPAFPYIAASLKDMADAGIDLDPAAIEIASKLGRQAHAEETRKRHAVPERRSIVYYIRRSDLIKIGTTSNPARRFDSLMPDEILAHEPGDETLEAIRHKQFSPERVSRRNEYFRQSQRLLKHIAELKDLHGPPHPSWSSIDNLGTGYLASRIPVQLPDPVTEEVATATEGAEMLSLHPSTISQWGRRGRIAPAGRNAKGHPLYYVEQLRFLKQYNEERLNRRKNDQC